MILFNHPNIAERSHRNHTLASGSDTHFQAWHIVQPCLLCWELCCPADISPVCSSMPAHWAGECTWPPPALRESQGSSRKNGQGGLLDKDLEKGKGI